jgi:putative transposase
MGTDSTVRGHRSDANSRTRHLHAVLDEYVAHYNRHRPHRARNLRPPDSDDIVSGLATGRAVAGMRRRNVLGGLIHEYQQAA